MILLANYPEQFLCYLDTAPSSQSPSDMPFCHLPAQIFFFFLNSQIIVDIVRKIQFLVEVYVPQRLSLGEKIG